MCTHISTMNGLGIRIGRSRVIVRITKIKKDFFPCIIIGRVIKEMRYRSPVSKFDRRVIIRSRKLVFRFEALDDENNGEEKGETSEFVL